MEDKRLTFGLTPGQEERYRTACFSADRAKASRVMWLILVPIVIFALNDYWLLGLSWKFYSLAAMRSAMLLYTIWMLRFIRNTKSFGAYDQAVYVWSLVFASFVLAINSTRPQAFVLHEIIIIVAVFVTLLVIPNAFRRQAIVATVFTIGEGLILGLSLHTQESPAALTLALGLVMSYCVALSASWQLHAQGRRAFAAAEGEAAAREALRESEARDQQIARGLLLTREYGGYG
jgi:hypothetical protein